VKDLPARLLTSEAAEYLRLSVRTFFRRREQGRLRIDPIDRGAELLWLRDDVLRAGGMLPGAEVACADRPAPALIRPPIVRPTPMNAQSPVPKPRLRHMSIHIERATSGREYAHLLDSGPFSLSVEPDIGDAGDWRVFYVRRPKWRAEGWPERIWLPRSHPQPVRLDTEEQYQTMLAEARSVHEEHMALKATQAAARKAARKKRP
jgi:hypothetical protein